MEFAGYNTPHPLDDRITFRIQCRPGHSGVDVFKRALNDARTVFADIRVKAQAAIEEHRREEK